MFTTEPRGSFELVTGSEAITVPPGTIRGSDNRDASDRQPLPLNQGHGIRFVFANHVRNGHFGGTAGDIERDGGAGKNQWFRLPGLVL